MMIFRAVPPAGSVQRDGFERMVAQTFTSARLAPSRRARSRALPTTAGIGSN